MAITLLFPYYAVYGGKIVWMQGPTTDSLPLMPDSRGENLVLTQAVGVFAAGSYQWVSTKWQFIIDYATICNELFMLSQAYVCIPEGGDNLLPIGPSGSAVVYVYRNGVLLTEGTNYTVVSNGISLVRAAILNEVYVVLQNSPLTPTTSIPGGGGGIVDAPTDNVPYIRKNAAWENIQNELNEGVFTGS